MKHIHTLLLLVITGLLIFSQTPNNNTDLEIYTDHDIYYIKGLRVMSETGEIDKTFKDMAELKWFMSQQTARDIEY